jgi:flagellar protein FlbT
MPLKLDLKPFERLIINGASIRNGDKRTSLVFENHCVFLRESEIIRDSDADTAAKKLCVILQVIYLADDKLEPIQLFYEQAAELLKAAPSMAHFMLAIQNELESERYHAAIKKGRELITYEKSLLAMVS